jgi:tetratricopeptide (TPR) repeat protein
VTHQCGPAALATVLGASGVETTPDALVPAVYVPGLHGSLQVELLAASRRAGRIPYAIEPALDALIAEIDAGRPVLVLQNLGFTLVPRWHYAVVVGYSLDDDRLVLRSGRTRREVVAAERFERTWSRAGGWGIVLLAPGELPARPAEDAYVAAVAAFEGANPGSAALPAWERAFELWSQSDDVVFAFGNTLLGAGERHSAERCYGALLARSPDHVGARNNLAMLLAERGCAAAASSTLAPAFDAARDDAAWLAVLEQSGAEIAALPADEARCLGERLTAAELERRLHGISCGALEAKAQDLERAF